MQDQHPGKVLLIRTEVTATAHTRLENDRDLAKTLKVVTVKNI